MPRCLFPLRKIVESKFVALQGQPKESIFQCTMVNEFSIKLHYGGYLDNGCYQGGFSHNIESFYPDYISYFEMVNAILELAPDFVDKKIQRVVYCSPEEDFMAGSKTLCTDYDAIELAMTGRQHGVVNVYIIFEKEVEKVVVRPQLLEWQRQGQEAAKRVTPSKPKKVKRSAPISPLQQRAARLKKIREKLRERDKVDEPNLSREKSKAILKEKEEPSGSKGKGKSKVLGTLESSEEVAMDCSYSLSEEADEDVHSEDEGVEFYDTSSDEELADARRKLKAEKVKQKKKDREVSARDVPCFSEEDKVDSDSEDYFCGSIESEEEVEISESVIRKMISDEELKCQKWTLGMRFVSPDFLKEMVTRYAVLSGYPIVWRRSDKQRKEA